MSNPIKTQDQIHWFVYIIETNKNHLYTGITTDVNKRFELHEQGLGAKFFRMHSPKQVVYIEECDSKRSALQKERSIKKLSTEEKKELVKNYSLVEE